MPLFPIFVKLEGRAVLLVGAIVKAGVPDIHGLEKFMDFGFVNEFHGGLAVIGDSGLVIRESNSARILATPELRP